MPELKNVRQERFARLVVRGIPPFRAYPKAGYRADNSAPYKLTDNIRVKARIAELQQAITMRTILTREWVLEQLIENMKDARASGNQAAASQALKLLGTEIGMFVERKESGKPGDFAGLSSPADVVAKVRADIGDAAADAIARVLASTATEDEWPADISTERQ